MIFLELEGVPRDAALPEVDPLLADRLATIGESLLARGGALSAERAFRAALARYERLGWEPGVAVAKGGLGGSLTALGRPADAEPYLLESYRTVPDFDLDQQRVILERLIDLYEALEQSASAEQYRQALDQLPLPPPQQEPDPHKTGA